MRSTSDMLRLQRVRGIESRAGGLAPIEVIEEIVLVQCMSQVLAHTDEIQRSSKCRLSRVDRKWLPYGQNDATG